YCFGANPQASWKPTTPKRCKSPDARVSSSALVSQINLSRGSTKFMEISFSYNIQLLEPNYFPFPHLLKDVQLLEILPGALLQEASKLSTINIVQIDIELLPLSGSTKWARYAIHSVGICGWANKMLLYFVPRS